MQYLIEKENADTFFFGSRSAFNDLCYQTITELKKTYPYIRRVYVRAEYECAYKDYIDSLLLRYEDTYFPEPLHGAGIAVYIKRNQLMIDSCEVLVAYYDEEYMPKTGKRSGTKAAVVYARGKKKRVINVFEKTESTEM